MYGNAGKRLIEAIEFGGAERDPDSSHVFTKVRDVRRAGDGNNPGLPGQQPCKRDLGWRAVRRPANGDAVFIVESLKKPTVGVPAQTLPFTKSHLEKRLMAFSRGGKIATRLFAL